MNIRKIYSALAISICVGFSQPGLAALSNYSQNFESLNAADSYALGDEGYLAFAQVYDNRTGQYIYSYNNGSPFWAPNGDYPGFSAIEGGEGGIDQGSQYLSTFSDYGNSQAGLGYRIDTQVFREQEISASDSGIYTFSFDAKASSVGGIAAPTTSSAFIRILDPGYFIADQVEVDMSSVSSTDWETFSLNLDIDGTALNGYLLEFGWNTITPENNDSTVYYDNINFASAVPIPAAAWLFGSALIGLVGFKRRK